MIVLLHKKAKEFSGATKDGKELPIKCETLVGAFWELAKTYPQEVIIWRDQEINYTIDKNISKCFSHELIMASYAVENQFIPDQIGYIDQLPFININYNVVYPTWRMSSDLGGIFGKTLSRFKATFGHIQNFEYLINSIAKTGQQNGLFCYSDPRLVKSLNLRKINFTADNSFLFNFVAQHYKKEWLGVLFFCLWKFEKKWPVIPLLKSLKRKSFFRKDIFLPIMDIKHQKGQFEVEGDIDVIIPTLLRAEHLENFLNDLKEQSKLPNRVIIIEQDSEPGSQSQLHFLKKEWPFKVVHHFIHRTGACYARNLALESVTGDYVFFADDDIRINSNLLEDTIEEMNRMGVGCLNMNAIEPGQNSVFRKVKQWGAFGSGISVVRSKYALRCRFSEAFEYGYGEDADYGMKLREAGCDIIYHPELQVQHLKAPIGGFRKKPVLAWEEEVPMPKPSPTLMMLVKKYNSPFQIRGFKISLFLKFYRSQQDKNPFSYWKRMEGKWEKSEEWAERLEIEAEVSNTLSVVKRERE